MIHILKGCSKEISLFPLEVREDLADALARLEQGQRLSMPLSRPMPIMGPGVHELRLRDRSGIYRVVYVFVGAGMVCLVHAFKKKTQATPAQNVKLVKLRLKEIESEK